LNIPEDLIYTEEHEWVRVTGENAIVGITDYAQSQLGDIIFLELPDVGDKIIAGDSFGEIEAVKTVSELYAPVDGLVIEVNNNLEDFPEKVNKDCYGDGWIIKIKPENKIEKEDLLDHKQYSNIIE
jgi:glycine cleavage system H protein|tara:strand:- start:2740 stop:3117 length:378 start_codon:yes stop_codon:yes gene_type:complete